MHCESTRACESLRVAATSLQLSSAKRKRNQDKVPDVVGELLWYQLDQEILALPLAEWLVHASLQ